jgi:hypothetical protein
VRKPSSAAVVAAIGKIGIMNTEAIAMKGAAIRNISGGMAGPSGVCSPVKMSCLNFGWNGFSCCCKITTSLGLRRGSGGGSRVAGMPHADAGARSPCHRTG